MDRHESGDFLMSEPKVLFVKQFLATLTNLDVFTIPINNESFTKGVASMSEYFYENEDEFGNNTKQLEMLFLKYSTRGEYQQFAEIIESFNGRLVSLENPRYIKANIKLENDYKEDLIENTELGISKDCFTEIATRFKVAAGI